MPLHLRPVGPLPEGVYWRRRAAMLGGPLLALLLLAQCGDDDDSLQQAAPAASAPSPTPTLTPLGPTAPTPTATASPSATPVVACTDADLRAEATSQRPRYALGARPVLRLAVRNAGAGPCARPLGQGAVELTVFSGRDRIWSSDDCAPDGEPGPEVLQPGELRVITLTWAGRRSRPGCPDGAEAIEPGTYRVVGRVGSLTTDAAGFRVLG